MAMFVEDMNCTERCRSFQHGQEICAISTKGTDREVLCLWKSTCMKFHKIKDEFGRSAVHIAASTGRPKVVEWLVKREGADINAKDFLSGYTPLHRSIYFGHLDVARTLIRLDASLSIQDQEGYFPLDLCQLDSPLKIREEELHRSPNEVYVWGSNENYNLGTGTEQPRFIPEILDRSKKLPWGYLASCFTQIAMERYHTLFLHWSYDVYSCGYGVGGRLGLGNEFAALTPTKIDLGSDSRCVKVAVGPDHSLFLMSSGEVKSCGLNENSVLGHNHAMKKVFAPKHVDVSSSIIDIAASRFHSVFISPDNIYTCGINIGQMCKPDVIEKVVKPIKITFPFDLEPKSQRQGHGQKGKFTGVASNECAIAVAHNGGNIYILKNYDCITLNTRHVDIQKINLVGGLANWSRDKVSHGEGDSSLQSKTVLTMFVLIKSGRLLIWREGSEQPAPPLKNNAKNCQVAQFNLVVFNAGRALNVRDFNASCTAVILITDNGEAYKALWNVGASPTCFPNMNSPASKPSGSKSVNQWSYVVQHSTRHHAGKDPFSNMMLEHLKLKRIPNIYNGIGAFCDPRGNNFAITQKHQKADQVVLPVGMASEINEDFGVLLMETSVEDNIHDVIFQVRSNLYPAHRFVIASSCKVLFELLKKEDQSQVTNDNDTPRVVLNDVEPRVFEQILQYLYTNNCDILISGKFSCKPDDPDWVELCKLYARKLGLHDLQKRLKVVVIEGGVNHGGNSKCNDVKFSLKAHLDLCDIDLISDDDMHTQVHLCVLVARLEYFKSMMLSNYWLEGSRSHCQKQLKFPSSKAVMDIFIQMMYEGSFTYNNTGTKKDLEVLSQALVASDLLLSQQYRSQIECSLAECISLKSVSEIIHLAEICNAPQLKDSCIEFITWNIAPLLENHCLESIPDGIMDEISRHYRSRFARIEYRKITDVTAPEKGAYEAAEERFKDTFRQLDAVVDAEYVTPSKSQSNKGKTKLQNRNRTISGSSAHEAEGNNNSFCFDDEDYENSEFDLTPLGPSYPEKFTVVKKHVKHSPRSPPYHGKESSPTPTTTTKITIPLPSRTLKFLPTVEETKSSSPTFTALPSPLTKKTHNTTPIPALKPSDFPSFESVYVNSKSTSIKGVDTHAISANATNDIGKSGIKPQSQLSSPSTSTKAFEGSGNGGGGAVSSVKTGGVSRRKTKWLSLNDTAVASKANVSNSPAVPESNSRDPKNPWQRQKTTNLPLKTQVEQTQDGAMCFDDIVQHEELKKKNLRKALDKPLRATQIEDQAVSELLKRYTSEDVIEGYELLQVELLSTDDYAIPVWRKTE